MNKRLVYEELLSESRALLEGETDLIARMSGICAILKMRLPWVSWVGFYRSAGDGTLSVGPYQGEIGCSKIPIGAGVCGTAAATGTTQIVEDVHAFPGHIACDPLSRSEIVVPVRNSGGELIAVLDLDSRLPAAFDETDRDYLETLSREVWVSTPAAGA